MPKNNLNVTLKGLDELLFSTEEQRQEEKREQVQQIPIDELYPFTNHPFKVLEDDSMAQTVKSIKEYGILSPLIARPRPDGDGYEIISGHRRQFAAREAGLETLPVIVRDMDDDAATILMVDSNLQREQISPSEKAFAYKMKLDALKHQGARSDLTSRQVVGKLEAAALVGKVSDESGRQVQRYVRLTNLIPELLDMVDNKKISFNPAVELSYLDEKQQRAFLEAMDSTQNAPSVSQAQKLKKMAQKGEFTAEKASEIMEHQALCKQADDEIARLEKELQALTPAPETQSVSTNMKAIRDFLEQKVDVHGACLAPELIDQFVEVVTPIGDYTYRWKLNTGRKKSKDERTDLMAVTDSPILAFTIDFETAKRYREANKMPHQFRRAAWTDLTVEVYL